MITSLSTLNDKQNSLLNQLAYVDLLSNWQSGMTVYEALRRAEHELANEFKKNDLDNLILKDYKNLNDSNGFVGISFITPSGDVGISFRGTEGLEKLNGLFDVDMRDNIIASLHGDSKQIREASAFFDKNKCDQGKNYLYGHSKGGNLALEVYVRNYNEIKKVNIINAQPINHFTLNRKQRDALWRDGVINAIVIDGDIVAYLGSSAYPIRIVKNNGKDNTFFGPHHISSMKFDDKTGKALDEEQPFLNYPKQYAAALYLKTIVTYSQVKTQLRTNPVVFCWNLITRIYNLTVNNMYEKAKQLYDWGIKKAGMIKEWSGAIAEAVKSFLISVITPMTTWWNRTFNSGNNYADENPLISVDTYKLSEYAQSLNDLNWRLEVLGVRVASLYLKVGLRDLKSLLNANFKIGKSSRLRKSAKYLQETAEDFEQVERKILIQLV
ncbi:MAG: DUF2974 domain-containing protein [Oscillospiraceae bacterium]|jgi:hypothetical protein|nr:DUF2974 domain-containing protein [Oscillospiraceae bacterium]